MTTFLSEEALVAAYWRRLARSIDPGAGTRKKPSSLESEAHFGPPQHFAALKGNVKPAIPRRRTRALQLRNDQHLRKKMTSVIAD